MTQLPDTNTSKLFGRNGKYSPFPDTMARRLTCKYPENLWKDIDGVITCPICGDTLQTFYFWQLIIVAFWVLDMGVIWLTNR